MSRIIVSLAFILLLAPTFAFGALKVPGSITAEAEGPNGASVLFRVTVAGGNDGSDGRPADTVTCSPSSGSTFPIGTTTVSCVGSEGSTGSFPVTVIDSTAPELDLPSDITIVTANPSGEVVTFTATAFDIVDGSLAVSCTPPSGTTFPIGTTTVTCTATDSRDNPGSGVFSVTVATSPPPPGNPNIVAEATGPDGARVVFDTGEEEDGDGRPGSGGCSPVPGSTFPLGDTLVTCPSGNFTISVVDTTPPELTLPETIVTVATGPSGAAVTYSATATDLVDGSVAVSCSPPSGSTFALGASTVTCSASDSQNNSVSATFDIEVVPGIAEDITAEATGPDGAVVTFTPGVDGGGQPITCSPASGTTFPLGETEVTCSSGATFTVTVVDTTPPDLSLPADLTIEATGPSGATVSYIATATDLVDGSVTVVCTPPSGSTFALGTTSVACSAADAHANSSNGSFSVTVADTTPPTLTLPSDMTVEATSSAGAIVTFTATAEDLVDGSVAVACTPPSGSTFPIGTTLVTCTADDSNENSALGSFEVDVVDTTPPEITSVTVSPDTIWPPNKKLVAVTVTIAAEDAVDPAPLLQIYAITCDESFGSGDAVITGPLTANLRADRDAHADGRVYTLHVEAIDSFGNRSTATVTVTVPHDQSNGGNTTTTGRRRAVGRG